MFVFQRIVGPRHPTTQQRNPPKPMDRQHLKLTNLSGGAAETIRCRQRYEAKTMSPILVNRRRVAQRCSRFDWISRPRIIPQESVFVFICSASGFQRRTACSCITPRCDATPSNRCCSDHRRLEPPLSLNRFTGFVAPPPFTQDYSHITTNTLLHA